MSNQTQTCYQCGRAYNHLPLVIRCKTPQGRPSLFQVCSDECKEIARLRLIEEGGEPVTQWFKIKPGEPIPITLEGALPTTYPGGLGIADAVRLPENLPDPLAGQRVRVSAHWVHRCVCDEDHMSQHADLEGTPISVCECLRTGQFMWYRG